jgi:PAS domain S-box-containing protein
MAMEMAKLVNWEYDVTTDTFTFDDQFYALFTTTAEREGGTKMRPSEYAKKFLPPEDADIVVSEINAALSSKDPNFSRQIEHDIIRRDGVRRTIAVTFRVDMNPSGNIVKMYGADQDITERKQIEEDLRTLVTRNDAILATIPDIIMEVDDNKRYTWANQSGLRFFGDDVVGREADYYFEGEQDTYNKVRPLFDGSGKIIHIESWQRRKDGEKRLLSWQCKDIKDKQGRVVGALSSAHDITESMRAERALYEANHKLNIMTSITRHDINNQLVVLNGNLTLLEKKQTNDLSMEYLRKAKAATKLIYSMVQFTREYEEIGMQNAIWHDLKDLVSDASRDIILEEIRVVNDVPDGIEVFADPMIDKVFHNLIDNAVRHGGDVTAIRFHVEDNGGSHKIICEDDGDGISPDVKEKIFTKNFGDGHGLGLLLSREILAITGITIEVKDEEGKGARFEISIPADDWRSSNDPLIASHSYAHARQSSNPELKR